jgi:hypothetical protein
MQKMSSTPLYFLACFLVSLGINILLDLCIWRRRPMWLRNMVIAALVASMFALAGCSLCWTKPGFTQAEWNRDRYECERDVRQSSYYGGGIIGGYNMQEFFNECLVARGYYTTDRHNCQ